MFWANFLMLCYINPFVPNAPFHYPLKRSENRKVFWCFQAVEKGCIRKEWVKQFFTVFEDYFYFILLGWKLIFFRDSYLVFVESSCLEFLNPFIPKAPFLYLLNTSENLSIFWCFQREEKRSIGNEWVNNLLVSLECG